MYFSERPENEDVWPLTSQELALLRLNRKYLMDNIYPSQIVNECFQSDCLNALHCETITAQRTRSAKARLLVDIIKYRSIAEYRTFIEALRAAHHEHVADVLETKGGEVECCLG